MLLGYVGCRMAASFYMSSTERIAGEFNDLDRVKDWLPIILKKADFSLFTISSFYQDQRKVLEKNLDFMHNLGLRLLHQCGVHSATDLQIRAPTQTGVQRTNFRKDIP